VLDDMIFHDIFASLYKDGLVVDDSQFLDTVRFLTVAFTGKVKAGWQSVRGLSHIFYYEDGFLFSISILLALKNFLLIIVIVTVVNFW